jgi:hypothetical protein
MPCPTTVVLEWSDILSLSSASYLAIMRESRVLILSNLEHDVFYNLHNAITDLLVRFPTE